AAHHSQTASTGSLTAVCLHNPRPPPPQTAHERSLSCVTFRKKYILCVLKLAAVSASHCTLVIKAILTNLFTKTLYISNIELYLANF
ncbi:hypothetical protein FO152_09240, partial [Campylobacter jejuni]|nr:hypothetical protein [Campylobacter jejuni]